MASHAGVSAPHGQSPILVTVKQAHTAGFQPRPSSSGRAGGGMLPSSGSTGRCVGFSGSSTGGGPPGRGAGRGWWFSLLMGAGPFIGWSGGSGAALAFPCAGSTGSQEGQPLPARCHPCAKLPASSRRQAWVRGLAVTEGPTGGARQHRTARDGTGVAQREGKTKAKRKQKRAELFLSFSVCVEGSDKGRGCLPLRLSALPYGRSFTAIGAASGAAIGAVIAAAPNAGAAV
jgi:hypothetical protein